MNMSQKRIQNRDTAQHSSDMVERVARIICRHVDDDEDAWGEFRLAAQDVLKFVGDLEVFHRAELAQALNSALEMVLEATQSGNFSSEEFNRCNALLAKIGGDA